jgi:hypothetical protein
MIGGSTVEKEAATRTAAGAPNLYIAVHAAAFVDNPLPVLSRIRKTMSQQLTALGSCFSVVNGQTEGRFPVL